MQRAGIVAPCILVVRTSCCSRMTTVKMWVWSLGRERMIYCSQRFNCRSSSHTHKQNSNTHAHTPKTLKQKHTATCVSVTHKHSMFETYEDFRQNSKTCFNLNAGQVSRCVLIFILSHFIGFPKHINRI